MSVTWQRVRTSTQEVFLCLWCDGRTEGQKSLVGTFWSWRHKIRHQLYVDLLPRKLSPFPHPTQEIKVRENQKWFCFFRTFSNMTHTDFFWKPNLLRFFSTFQKTFSYRLLTRKGKSKSKSGRVPGFLDNMAWLVAIDSREKMMSS